MTDYDSKSNRVREYPKLKYSKPQNYMDEIEK